VLPAVMQSAAVLKDTYSQPVYGAPGGIPSRNYRNMVWWQQDTSGAVLDPYKLLVAELGEDSADDEAEGINQGGAASNAYLRLQFEDLLDSERLSIERGLLRYCELDTLAMVMIFQAWNLV